MKRFPHYLRPNKSQRQPHSIIYVDTETRPDVDADGVTHHRLRFGWACYGRTRTGRVWESPEWFRFTSAASFWEWMESRARPHTRLYMFAHNWAFDACVIDTFRILPDRGWQLTQAIIESPPVILVWRRDRVSIEMLDTLNWWRMSLAQIGDSLGLPKLTMPAADASPEEWDIYARRDVEILRVALHHWWDFLLAYDLGGFARTIAGQAIRTYRHRFMDHQVLVDDDTEALKLARESYHGGRVEAFRIGRVEGPIHCFDVNAMYPFVMRDHLYPAALTRRVRRVGVSDLQNWITRFCLVARVELRTDRNRFAHVIDDKLCFPIGRFQESLTTPDLADALAHDEVVSVEECAIYERAPLFSRFVSELYTLRLEAGERGDEVQRWLLKKLMNALYGKFGQKGAVWGTRGPSGSERVRVWREYDCETGTERLLRSFAGILQEKLRDEEARESHPAIAAHVTAHARAYLWDLFQRVDPARVIYCDTDSLLVGDEGARCLGPLESEQTLGGIKREWSAPWVEVYGAKDYRTPHKTVCKGVRAKARWIGLATVEQEQWSSLPGLVWSGQLSAPTTITMTKHLKRVYAKGEVGPGGMVSPLALTSAAD